MRGSYIRVGDSDQPMTEYKYIAMRLLKKDYDELRTVDRATMKSLKKII